jgi:hypothetical protein
MDFHYSQNYLQLQWINTVLERVLYVSGNRIKGVALEECGGGDGMISTR